MIAGILLWFLAVWYFYERIENYLLDQFGISSLKAWVVMGVAGLMVLMALWWLYPGWFMKQFPIFFE